MGYLFNSFGSPDAGQLSQVISQATGPAFILGAVAGFVPILMGRMNAVVDRIRHLNDISDDERVRLHLKSDIPRLRQRLGLLNSAVLLTLASGVCTSLLLVVSFASAFPRRQHVFGAAVRWTSPGFVESCELGIRVAVGVSSCPPVSWHSLVRPLAEPFFRSLIADARRHAI
jgi:hypothetical protein